VVGEQRAQQLGKDLDLALAAARRPPMMKTSSA
jgi:hypothetical protein